MGVRPLIGVAMVVAGVAMVLVAVAALLSVWVSVGIAGAALVALGNELG